MRMHIDISGQVTQANKPSSLAFVRDDGVRNTVYMDSETKRRILKKYCGKTSNLVEKLHCILIYFCVRNHLEGIDEFVICRDINPRRINKIMLSVFRGYENFPKIAVRGHDHSESKAHKIALRAF